MANQGDGTTPALQLLLMAQLINHQTWYGSLGYLLIYPPQIATVMKLISFCSKYNPVSDTKSLGESREWNMVFQGNIWSLVKAF